MMNAFQVFIAVFAALIANRLLFGPEDLIVHFEEKDEDEYQK